MIGCDGTLADQDGFLNTTKDAYYWQAVCTRQLWVKQTGLPKTSTAATLSSNPPDQASARLANSSAD
jgi:hypothetical protein